MTTKEEFDRDPEAIAWARGYIQERYDFAEKAEQKAKVDWNDSIRKNETRLKQAEYHDRMMRWRRIKNMLQMWFIGGEGCVITCFDERRPAMLEMLDASR